MLYRLFAEKKSFSFQFYKIDIYIGKGCKYNKAADVSNGISYLQELKKTKQKRNLLVNDSEKLWGENEGGMTWVGLLCCTSVQCEYHKSLSVISLTGDLSVTIYGQCFGEKLMTNWNYSRHVKFLRCAKWDTSIGVSCTSSQVTRAFWHCIQVTVWSKWALQVCNCRFIVVLLLLAYFLGHVLDKHIDEYMHTKICI